MCIRDRDCKRALQESGGDPEAALEWLRKAGKKTMEQRAGKETSFGRIAVWTDPAGSAGAMIELRCESAPVAANEEFVALANDLARQLATGPGAATADELLDQPSPSRPGQSLRQQFDDLLNRIREMFRLQRIVRVDGRCAGYVHHNGSAGVIVQIEGGNLEVAKDVCMQVVSMRPSVIRREELAAEVVEKERQILMEAVQNEAEALRQEAAEYRSGKRALTEADSGASPGPSPAAMALNLERKAENLVKNRAKIAEGRLRELFYAKHCLLDQPFVKDSKQTVGKLVEAAGMKIIRFVRWELGKE